MKYASAAWRILLAWAARRAHLPTGVVHNLEDEASMAMFTCTLDFETVEVVGKDARP